MKKNFGFDHLIGDINGQWNEEDLTYQRIIELHSKEQSIEAQINLVGERIKNTNPDEYLSWVEIEELLHSGDDSE